MINLISKILIISLPFFLISGPFLADLSVCLLGLIIIFKIFKDKKWEFFNNIYFKLFIFFWLYILLSSFLSSEIYLSLESSLFYFRFIFFGLAIGFFLNHDYSTIKFLNISIWFALVILIFDSHLQFLFGKNLLGNEPELTYRISSLFGDELILGSFISRVLLFGIILISIIQKDDKFDFKKTIIYSLLISLAGSSIFISGERSAMLYYFMTFLLIFIFCIHLRKIFFLSFIFLSIAISSVTFLDKEFKKRMFDYTFNEMFVTHGDFKIFSITHESHYKSAILMFLDKPILGHGPKTFRIKCSSEEYYVVHGCSTHPHNTYIQLLSETGIIGFMFIFSIFIYSLFFLLKNIYKKFIKHSFYQDPSFILLNITLFIFLWPIVPNGNFFNNWLNCLFFILVGFFVYFKIKKSKT